MLERFCPRRFRHRLVLLRIVISGIGRFRRPHDRRIGTRRGIINIATGEFRSHRTEIFNRFAPEKGDIQFRTGNRSGKTVRDRNCLA